MKKTLILLLSIGSLVIWSQSLRANTDQRDQLVKQLVQRITIAMDAVDATLPQINILIKKGEKQQAKALVEKALKQIEQIEADQKQLAQLDAKALESVSSINEIQETKRYLTNKFNQLRYTNVYISGEAKLFEDEYPSFIEDVKSALSNDDVSFVDSDSISDWKVTIKAKVRKHNKADFGGAVSYFVYVDAQTTIVKTASGKRLLDKTISEKGGSPLSFEQAAQEAYKKIAPKVSAVIKEQIQQ